MKIWDLNNSLSIIDIDEVDIGDMIKHDKVRSIICSKETLLKEEIDGFGNKIPKKSVKLTMIDNGIYNCKIFYVLKVSKGYCICFGE